MKRLLVLILFACGLQAQMLTAIVAAKAGGGGGGGSGYTGPGDISSGASAWWGLRAYSSATRGTKAVNVCDSGDAHCVDAFTDAATGVLIIPSSNPNCASSACTIKTFYDQSGGTLDVTQATEAIRPTLTTSCLGSLPCATFTSTNVFLSSAGSLSSVAQPYSSSWVAKRNASGTYQYVLSTSTESVNTGFVSTATNVFVGTTTNLFGSPATEAATHSIQGVFNSTSSKVNIDGSSTTGDAGTTALAGTLVLGDSGGVSFAGLLVEGGWWPSDVSANFSTMSANQHTFWGY